MHAFDTIFILSRNEWGQVEDKEEYITSNNRDTHIPVSIHKDINSVLENFVIRDKCRYVLKHNPCWH